MLARGSIGTVFDVVLQDTGPTYEEQTPASWSLIFPPLSMYNK